MPAVSFRDFVSSVMQSQIPTAVSQLQTLLGVSETEAQTATTFFQEHAKDPAFLPKAMGLRAAVESGDDVAMGQILVDCFGLDEAQRATAVATVRTHYPVAK
jgi:hypothetical protein